MTAEQPFTEPIYVFLDEGGNFDFSPGGSKYFTITAMTCRRPFRWDEPLTSLRYNLWEQGHEIEYFHACDDRQVIRNQVFSVIESCLHHIRADCVVVEKRKAAPSIRDVMEFYPRMLGYLLRYVANNFQYHSKAEIIVVTDRIPVNSKRKAVEKAIKATLTSVLPANVRYRIWHHDSKSCLGLQMADYLNWAILRRLTMGDDRSFKRVEQCIKSEFDIFQSGTKIWY